MLKDCYAFFDQNTATIRLGNSKIEKVLEIKSGRIRTKSICDKVHRFNWSGNSLWQSNPIILPSETPEIIFNTETVDAPYNMKSHLKAVLCLKGQKGTAWYEYLIFPEISFIYNQNFVSNQGRIDFFEQKNNSNAPTGIETEQDTIKNAAQFDYDILDSIPLGERHLNVKSFKLFDKTDYNDMLVEEQNASVYNFKNGELYRDGNIFCINDYTNDNSIMLIKHSPTESSALNRKNHDLMVQGSVYATLYGTGIDFNALPEGKVPYYASAVGVGKTDDIYNEMWRYNTAFCTDDPNGALFCMSNTWGDRSQDIAVCESFMLGEIERAHTLGVDIVQIDDGWQLGITANSRRKAGGVWEGYYADNSNFWAINPEKFPNGLEPLIKKAKSYGIELALWFSPDSSNDFANADRDIDTILNLHNTYGIKYFKLDGVKIRNKLCEMRFLYLMDELVKLSNGQIRFNLDVTAEDRFGYMYGAQYGSLFVENRYTDFPNYFPHNTFKNVWNLARVIPTRRLQMELLNPRRNAQKYDGILFAPNTYSPDYLFASVMVANPLFWMEMTNLCDEDATTLAKISDVYKKYKKELFNSRVIPVGEMPNGTTFSGYCCKNSDDNVYNLILFRESSSNDTYSFKLPYNIGNKNIETVYQSADTIYNINNNFVTVNFSQKQTFVWIRIS